MTLDLGDAPAEDALPRLLALWRDARARFGSLRGMRFAKWHGLGNDYLIVDREAWPLALTPARARRICDPHFGVGGDGILEVSVRGRACRG